MAMQVIIKKNAYYDSVTLMSISGKITALPDITEAVIAMATAMNKELLANVGMLTAAAAAAEVNDLIIAVKSVEQDAASKAIELAEGMLASKGTPRDGTALHRPATLQAAVSLVSEANLAIISVPGDYAAREARAALKNGMHVMMFSDNVSLEDEISLKEYAHSQGLLMMGPDCGTAIINGVGLCFANAVKQGNIGIVGASGTGTQEVTVLIDKLGGGVSQVLGTGGRDLSEAVGGIMMLDGLAALDRDEVTKVITLISKPPAKAVSEKVMNAVKRCSKPVIICFINGEEAEAKAAGAYFAGTLEAAAAMAVQLAAGSKQPVSACRHKALEEIATSVKGKLKPEQKYIRGLFCGGTLCDEAGHIVKSRVGQIYSNIAKSKEQCLDNPLKSSGHTFIDLGDDVFTLGRPHPMIEPALRLPRILQEAHDNEVAVILLDIVLGYGAHPDPAGVTIPAILEAKQIAAERGQHLEIIAYVCGTDSDPQCLESQQQKLAAAGVTLGKSNSRAAYLAAAIVS